jgi:hypothetical protein
MVPVTTKEMNEEIYYWFINQASTSPHMTCLITPYDRYDIPRTKINIYCDPLNLSTRQSVDILNNLFESGVILGINSSDLDDIESSYDNSPHKPELEELIGKSFVPSRQKIKKAIDHEENGDRLFYFLTFKGGKLWESIFKPKWNQYLRRRSDGINHIIDCANLDIGQKLISIEYLLSFDDENTYYSLTDTEIWETFTPWQVLYWKTYSVGYSVRYQTKHIEVNKSNESKELREEIRQAQEWLTNNWNWCTREYFDNWHSVKPI